MTAKQSATPAKAVSKNQARGGKTATKADKAVIAAKVTEQLAQEAQAAGDAQANQSAVYEGMEERRVGAAVVTTPPAASAMDFAVQQLSAPKAPQLSAPALQTPPALTAEFQQALAELQSKFGVVIAPVVTKAGKATKAEKAPKNQRNGYTHPGAGTKCAAIWEAADRISAQIHGVCPIALLKVDPTIAGENEHTIKTQYAKWRGYHGVIGRLPTIQAVHQVQGEYAGLPVVA